MFCKHALEPPDNTRRTSYASNPLNKTKVPKIICNPISETPENWRANSKFDSKLLPQESVESGTYNFSYTSSHNSPPVWPEKGQPRKELIKIKTVQTTFGVDLNQPCYYSVYKDKIYLDHSTVRSKPEILVEQAPDFSPNSDANPQKLTNKFNQIFAQANLPLIFEENFIVSETDSNFSKSTLEAVKNFSTDSEDWLDEPDSILEKFCHGFNPYVDRPSLVTATKL